MYSDGLQLFETLFEPFGRVGDILHGVGSQPKRPQACLFQHGKDGKGILRLGYAVVHSEKDVGVMVRSPFQEPQVRNGVFFREQSHVKACP